jgi:hypothetical protein
MLYIAIAMILVGVLCFVYVSLAPASSGKEMDRNELPGSRRRTHPTETDLKETLYNSRTRSPISDLEDEERILEERRVTNPTWQDTDSILYTRPVAKLEPQPEIVESSSVIGSDGEKLEPAPEERLLVQGLLFTDTKGKIPFDKKDLSALNLTEDLFRDLRRIGEGALWEDSGRLIFKVKNLSYTYEPRDLKQVIFFDEAVVFLPSRNDIPAPIFFTESIDSLRAFFAQAESKV